MTIWNVGINQLWTICTTFHDTSNKKKEKSACMCMCMCVYMGRVCVWVYSKEKGREKEFQWSSYRVQCWCQKCWCLPLMLWEMLSTNFARPKSFAILQIYSDQSHCILSVWQPSKKQISIPLRQQILCQFQYILHLQLIHVCNAQAVLTTTADCIVYSRLKPHNQILSSVLEQITVEQIIYSASTRWSHTLGFTEKSPKHTRD